MSCQSCPFWDKCDTNQMMGRQLSEEGYNSPDIMIIGDNPKFIDDRDGEVFAKDSGKKLRYLLEKAGINEKRVFVSYAVKCKPPGDKPKREAILNCQAHITDEILKKRPKVVILVGSIAVQSLIGGVNIKDHRGWWEDLDIDYQTKAGRKTKKKTFTTKVMTTYGPGACLADWAKDQYVIRDFKKVKQYIKTGELPVAPKLDVEVVTSLKKLEKVTQLLCKAKKFVYDFETTGLSFFRDEIIWVGFCIKPGKAYVIPYFVYDQKHVEPYGYNMDAIKKKWTPKEIAYAEEKINPFVLKHKKAIKKAFKRIFASPAKKGGHNAKFDNKFAIAGGFPVNNFNFDTIIEHSLVNENQYHDLTTVLEFENIHYGPYDKELWPYVGKTHKTKKAYFCAPPSMMAEYLGMDVDGPARLHPKFIKRLKKQKLYKLYKEQQIPLVEILTEMEYDGIKMDIPKLQEISKTFAEIIARIDKKMKKITKNKEFNPNSPKQLVEYFQSINVPFEKIGKKTKSRETWSTDQKFLTLLAEKRKFAKVPKLILESRKVVKLKGQFLDGKDGLSGMLSWTDDESRVHTNYNIHTPRTGRLSSNDPPMQVIPRAIPQYPDANIRHLFYPEIDDLEEQAVMFSIDYAQLELRVAAYLSGDSVMTREIQKGIDMHSQNAVVFGKILNTLPHGMTAKKFIKIKDYKQPKDYDKLSIKERKKIDKKVFQAALYSEIRTLAKTLGFGINYGREPITIAEEFGREVDAINEMFTAYFEKYFEFAQWRDDICEEGLTNGVLKLPWTNRRRRVQAASDWFDSEYSEGCWKRHMDIEAVKRQLMNFPVQGFANEIFTQAKIRLHKAFKKHKLLARLLLSLHDGILGEAPLSEIPKIEKLAKECMELVLGKGSSKVPLGIDFDVYDRWTGKKIEYKKVS